MKWRLVGGSWSKTKKILVPFYCTKTTNECCSIQKCMLLVCCLEVSNRNKKYRKNVTWGLRVITLRKNVSNKLWPLIVQFSQKNIISDFYAIKTKISGFCYRKNFLPNFYMIPFNQNDFQLNFQLKTLCSFHSRTKTFELIY
jgi:hypothetical protein